MSWLDILSILISTGIGLITIAIFVVSILDNSLDKETFKVSFMGIFMVVVIIGLTFGVYDKKAGTTIGTITSVDRNTFGTTAIYVKTSESEQEKYCIENNNLKAIAEDNIGKVVEIKYGSRVGLYSTKKCHDGPVKSIKKVEK